MIGLFLLVRDENNRATCVSQAVIMIITTAMTIAFQILLNDAIAPLLRFMPQTGMREEEKEVDQRMGRTARLRMLAWQYLKRVIPTRDPALVEGVFSHMYHDVEDSRANEHGDPVSLPFQHESLCIQKPVVWIPNDHLGISDDEISCLEQQYSNVRMSNGHACLDEKGRVKITQDASDASEWNL